MTRLCSAVLVVTAFLLPARAAAAVSGPVILGFAQSYVAPDSATCTHRGIDVGMQPSGPVEAPASGTVRFAGRVPGPHGGSVLAISLETGQGTVTMLPIERLEVGAGDAVDEGARLGTVAPAGDPSSEATHLHLGLKRGGVYVDPIVLLEPAGSQPEQTGSVAASPGPAATPVDRPARQTAPAAVLEAPAPAVAPVTAAVPSAESPMPEQRPGTAQDPAPASGELAPGVSLAPSTASGSSGSVASAWSGPEPSARRATLQPAPAAGTQQLLPAFARGTLAPAFGMVAAVLFGIALLVTRRALTRRVALRSPMSDRLGILLQHLKAGDTLCGLTSCSGPLPSQSRGH